MRRFFHELSPGIAPAAVLHRRRTGRRAGRSAVRLGGRTRSVTLVAVRQVGDDTLLHRRRLVLRRPATACRRSGVRGRRPLSGQGPRDRAARAARRDRGRATASAVSTRRRSPTTTRCSKCFATPDSRSDRSRRGGVVEVTLTLTPSAEGVVSAETRRRACDRGVAAADARAAGRRGHRRLARSGQHRPADSRRAGRRRIHRAGLSGQSGRGRDRRPARVRIGARRSRPASISPSSRCRAIACSRSWTTAPRPA